LPRPLGIVSSPAGTIAFARARLLFFELHRKLSLPLLSGRMSPVWSDDPAAETPIAHGLWMVVPRFARGNVGVVSRDLLWVDEDGPRWLDEGPLPRA